MSVKPVAIEGAINKAMRDDNKIKMPPTKDSLKRLFYALNLFVPTVKQLDCLVYCRGKKMEQAPERDFDMKKLIGWFELNLRTFKHLDNKKVDKQWLAENEMKTEYHRRSLPPTDFKSNPQAFIRRGTGTGGHHVNRII